MPMTGRVADFRDLVIRLLVHFIHSFLDSIHPFPNRLEPGVSHIQFPTHQFGESTFDILPKDATVRSASPLRVVTG